MKRKPQFLIIDDDYFNIELLSSYISSEFHNYEILKATTKEQAMNIYNNHQLELIITDWDMPEMSGLQHIIEIRKNKHTKNTPVIICSGIMITPTDLKIALSQGANDYIRKPINKTEIIARINSVLRFSIAQKKIIKSERLFKSIFQNSNIGICLISLKGKFMNINRELKKMLGYSKKELLLKNFNDILETPKECLFADFIIEIVNVKKQKISFEQRLINKNNEPLDCLIHMSILKNITENKTFCILHINDITKQKKLDAELKESEQKYRLITENASDVIWVMNLNTNKFTYISPAVFQLRGYIVEEAIAQNINQSLTPESATKVFNTTITRVKNFVANPQKNHIYTDELQQPCKNGEIIWIETATRYRYNIKKEIEVVGVSRNINKRKRIEASEIKVRNELRAILDNSSAVIYLKDKNFNYLLINKQYEKLFNIKEKDYAGKSDYDIHPKRIADKIRKFDQKIFASELNMTKEEIILINNEKKYYLSTKFLIYNEKKTAYAICGISTDITELKKREQQIKESEHKFNSIVSNANNAIIIIQDGILKFVNLYAAKLIGIKINDLINRHIADFAHPEDLPAIVERYKKRITGEEVETTYSYRYLTANKEVRWGEINSVLHKWENKPAVLSFLTDITPQKIAEEKILQQSKELIAQSEELKAALNNLANQNQRLIFINNDVEKSLNYARNIQKAVMPNSEYLRKILKEHFIFYKPKNIVSGDFYFSKFINNNLIVAVADSTGHGVPGAFMSMLGIAILNELVTKPEIMSAAALLNELRSHIKKSLNQTGHRDEQQDGMDMAFCVIDISTKAANFAGAYNPMWIFRKNEENKTEFIEIKADRQPVGIYFKETNFTNNYVQLMQNDFIYLFTDGYYSQFGSDKNRKYNISNFKKYLSEIYDKNADEQAILIENEFYLWKNGNIQTDDLLVLGMKITN